MTGAIYSEPARLQFLPGWRIIQNRALRPNEKLIVDYDTRRLPNYRKEHHGAVVWNVEIYIRFHPGGQFHKGSLLEPVRYVSQGSNAMPGPPIDYLSKPFEIVVPIDATQAELWFHTFDGVRGFQQAWDSRFGQNYWFNVARE